MIITLRSISTLHVFETCIRTLKCHYVSDRNYPDHAIPEHIIVSFLFDSEITVSINWC